MSAEVNAKNWTAHHKSNCGRSYPCDESERCGRRLSDEAWPSIMAFSDRSMMKFYAHCTRCVWMSNLKTSCINNIIMIIDSFILFDCLFFHWCRYLSPPSPLPPNFWIVSVDSSKGWLLFFLFLFWISWRLSINPIWAEAHSFLWWGTIILPGSAP